MSFEKKTHIERIDTVIRKQAGFGSKLQFRPDKINDYYDFLSRCLKRIN